MNYKTAYDRMMLAAKKKNLADGIDSIRKLYKAKGEVHHILPKKFGGANTFENMVVLDHNDHVYAHILLNLSLLQKNEIQKLEALGYTQVPENLRKMLKAQNALKHLNIAMYILGKKWPPTLMSIDTASRYMCVIARVNPDNELMVDHMVSKVFGYAMFGKSKFGYKMRLAL